MALSNKGTVVNVNNNKIPSGYTKPTVATFDDSENSYVNREISVAKAGVENANEVTTFTAIVAAITAAVTALITADFDIAGNTVDVYASVKDITTNAKVGDDLYTNGAVNYLCTVDIFVKTS